MIRTDLKLPPVLLTVVCNYGGLGDMIGRLPALSALINTQPHVSVDAYWYDYFVPLAKYLMPEGPRINHKAMSALPSPPPNPWVDFDPARLSTSGVHITRHAHLMLLDQEPSKEQMTYPVAPPAPLTMDLPSDALVFTVASTAPNRVWPAIFINRLAERARKRGYSPVLLGSDQAHASGVKRTLQGTVDDGIDRTLFVDLINKTTLIEALGVMQRARAVVGVDNGLIHLAACTAVPIVAGYTSVLAEKRMPARSAGQLIPVTPKLPCYGCQSRVAYANYDSRTCLFQDYACTILMTDAAFAVGLEKIKIIL